MVAQQGANKWRDILSQRGTPEATNPKGAEEAGKEGLSLGEGEKPLRAEDSPTKHLPTSFFFHFGSAFYAKRFQTSNIRLQKPMRT